MNWKDRILRWLRGYEEDHDEEYNAADTDEFNILTQSEQIIRESFPNKNNGDAKPS